MTDNAYNQASEQMDSIHALVADMDSFTMCDHCGTIIIEDSEEERT